MHTPHIGRASILLASIISFLMLLPACATEVVTPSVDAPPLDGQHSIYASILTHVVAPTGVDYIKLRELQPDLDRYRAQLAAAPIPVEPAAAMAHWINAYNALTLALVLETMPSDTPADFSVRKVSGFWKRYRFEVGGQHVSLNDIEHHILRPMGNPRIHFAINCASRSCPSLAPAPYLATTLNDQLEAAAKSFANNPEQLRLEDGKLKLNPILKWFGEDFDAKGGVATFLLTYVEEDKRRALLEDDHYGFFSYDWLLNRQD